MRKKIPFNKLSETNLYIDAIYAGGNAKNLSADPIAKLIPVGNSGGFRYKGKAKAGELTYVVLYSTFADPNWPDSIDLETGVLTYFGDNRTAGSELHKTPKRGNEILNFSFRLLHQAEEVARKSTPPFFIFTSAGEGRDVVFRGLAVPGADGVSANEDLVAVWRSGSNGRFQNYRSYFTILDAPVISRKWLQDIENGNLLSPNCPTAFRTWITTGRYTPLKAPATIKYRSKKDQLPSNNIDKKLLSTIYEHFKNEPHQFEHFAAWVIRKMDKNIVSCDVTRPSRDGGRDAVGNYQLGLANNKIFVNFALEAKCFAIDNSVGIKASSRLISRLRHRQFGIIVTTSFIATQAYQEIIEDGHPVIIVSGNDLVTILKDHGYNKIQTLKKLMESDFPC